MKESAEILRKKINLALDLELFTKNEIANLCGIKVESVNGWLNTGRISKANLVTVAKKSGWPLEWWLSKEMIDPPSQEESSRLRLRSALTDCYLMPEQIDEVMLNVKETELKNRQIAEDARKLQERHKIPQQTQETGHYINSRKITICPDEQPKIKINKRHRIDRKAG